MSFKHTKLKNYDNFDTLASQDARKFYYHYCRETKEAKVTRLERKLHKKVIVRFHELLFEEMCDGFEFRVFHRLGTFSIKKTLNTEKFDKDGNFKRHVNWKETCKLWKEQPEKHRKSFIYHPDAPATFSFVWSRKIAQFKNMHFYSTRFHLRLKRKLRFKILENPNFDAYERGY
jgi:hypothetical protein